MSHRFRPVGAILSLSLLLFCCSCATTIRLKSSALDFLYPQGTAAVPPAAVKLKLPLRVGLAFAPGESYQSRTFSEVQKQDLLARIAGAFRKEAEIGGVEVIPSSYLSPGGGFENMDRLSAALGIQVAVLISYDQIRFQESGRSSWAYWTLVGAYVVKGEKNEVRTFLDAVVYDISSRAMLFHVEGQDVATGKSTPATASGDLRKMGESGFERAADDLIVNLDTALDAFRGQAATGTVRGVGTPAIALYDSSGRPLHSGEPSKGAGSLGALELLAAAALIAAGWRRGSGSKGGRA